MSALGTKLARDLTRISGQALTIALVVASGIAGFVSLRSTYASLLDARARYYARERMPDLFVSATRVPEAIAARIEDVPGVATLETRLVGEIRVRLPNDIDPPSGRIHSIPDHGESVHAALRLRAGRLPEPGRNDEAVVLEPFASANGLRPGDSVTLVVRAVARRIRITGIVMSPEYVMSVASGEITPDPARFAVFWMRRRALAPLLDLDGAFDEATVRVARGADEVAIARRIERILEPWGANGVTTLARQPSNFMLEGELSQLRGLATVVPFLFLGVSAFLLHVVLSRILHLQRGQIATLRALGYTAMEVGLHYLAMVGVIVLAGAILGIGLGGWLGRGLTAIYAEFFHFPDRVYRLDARTALVAVVFGGASALAGALITVAKIIRMPPAEAMQPEAPTLYRQTFIDRVVRAGLLAPAATMVFREITRRPVRVLVSAVGIAFSVAIVVVGRFGYDSMEALMALQFHDAMREDITLGFTRPRDARALRELDALTGVIHVEGTHSVPVRVRRGHAFRDTVLIGMSANPTLRAVVDRAGARATIPDRGLVVSAKLAEVLGAHVGERLDVTWMDEDRRTRSLLVAALVDEPFGMSMYVPSDTLDAMTHSSPIYTTAMLRVAAEDEAAVLRAIRDRPLIATVTRKRVLLARFRAQSGEQMGTFTTVLSIFAAIIAVGIIYNDARIALSMRSHDLASLRVLGFTRAEISYVLLGELFVRVLLGVPLGLVLGRDWAHRIAATVDPETYRMPVTIATSTYLFAAGIALASAIVSALLVRRRLDHLDLVAVLKTRE